MTFYQNTMPWKIILERKQDGKKFTFYRSTTEYLSFLDELFNITYENTQPQFKGFDRR
jgi:hypothetical protein